MSETDPEVCIVGGGVAGMTAAIFTARAGLETLVVTHGESILCRNAHLENVPGFPLGVNARTFLSLVREQAEHNGVTFRDGRAERLSSIDSEFSLRIESGGGEADVTADYVVVASWSDTDYLEDLSGVGLVARGSKTFVDVDDFGRAGVAGLYAAGRIAEKPHQTIVSAGHGAEVALTLIEDSEVPYYHDWVAPEGYFTDRGRDLPPGCEEVGETERRRREEESLATMREYVAEPHPDEQLTHPSLRDDGE